ncbi:MAG: S41 family peptidase [Thermoanaerobaculia bacterium]
MRRTKRSYCGRSEGITDSPYLRPLAVLVDGRSGSGGDVFPATIQSLGRGLIIGTPTAGKTLSGDDAKLPGGYVLFFPHAEIVRIDGKRMEANPLQPDVLLSAEQTVNDDYLGQLLRKTFERSP